MANSWASVFGPGGKFIVDKLSKRDNVDPYGSLNPEQRQVVQALGPRLVSNMDPASFRYGGQLSESIDPNEQAIVDRFSRLAAVNADALGRFNYDDANFNDQFQSEIADPTFRDFKTNLAPYLEQELPTFSTARVNVLAREGRSLSDTLLKQRFAAREAAKDRALRAIDTAGTYGTAAAQLAAIPREIKQAGLDRSYLAFLQENKSAQTNIDQMLNFLGISTVTRESDPFLERILALAESGAKIAAAGSGGGAAKGVK